MYTNIVQKYKNVKTSTYIGKYKIKLCLGYIYNTIRDVLEIENKGKFKCGSKLQIICTNHDVYECMHQTQ